MINSPTVPPVNPPGPPPTIIRDIRLYHENGGHVRRDIETLCGKKIAGAYILEVHGFDRVGPFSKKMVFDKAPTLDQVMSKLDSIGDW